MSNGTQTVVATTQEIATPAQVAEMRAMVKKVRDVIARFHRIRRQNNERAAGLRASMVHPQQVQALLKSTRNPETEAQAVESLRQFITLLNGSEPTREEMQQGIPEGYEDRLAMTGIPFAIAAVALSAAGGVYSYFNYLTTVEEGNQQRTATPLERALQALSDNIWGVAAVGAIVLGGAIYIQSTRSTSERRKAEIERYRAAGKALDKSLKDSSKGSGESFTDKVKGLVQNAIFPPEKNPDLSPAEKLAKQVEDLSEDEQDRFFSLVDGEDSEEDSEEHEHHAHHEDHHGHHGHEDDAEESESESESETETESGTETESSSDDEEESGEEDEGGDKKKS
jgi:hypothetical protein